MKDMIALRNCPACDAPNATALAQYAPQDWHVAACDACDLVYQRKLPHEGVA